MCGDCILSSTGMTCPMNCPKNMRNAPCGGVRNNGNCEVYYEVYPAMKCVWEQAFAGTVKLKKNSLPYKPIQFAPNYAIPDSSA